MEEFGCKVTINILFENDIYHFLDLEFNSP